MKSVKKGLQSRLPLFVAIMGSVLLIVFLTFLGLKDRNVVRTTNGGTRNSNYVLVNEDNGAEFNGKNYRLGDDFVTLINQDSKNNWQTAARNIANAGVKSGQYDAEIIIPRNFSEQLLNLKSSNPQKALVSYRVRSSQNEISNQVVSNKVNTILKDFNQRIVQMYFSNIVGNLAEAQHNVNNMVGVEQTQHSDLASSYSSLKSLPQGFSDIVNTSSILDENNKSFGVDQQAFIESVKGLLQDNQNSLTEGSKSASEVKNAVSDTNKQSNQKLQTALKQFEAQYQLQKDQLNEQWQNDGTGYKEQYDQLGQLAQTQVGSFNSTDTTSDESVYNNFLSEAKAFQLTQTQRISELNDEIKSLETQRDNMENLKKQVAYAFTGDENTDPSSASSDQIKQAIVSQMSDTEKSEHLNQSYLDELKNNAESIQLPQKSDFEQLLKILQNKNLLDSTDAEKLADSYTIINKLGNSNQQTGKFELLQDQNENKFTAVTTDGQLTIPLNLNALKAGQTLKLVSDKQQISVTNLDDIATQISNGLQSKISSITDYKAHPVVSVNATDGSISLAIREEDGTATLPDNTETSVTVNANLSWQPQSTADTDQYLTVPYSWNLDKQTISSSSLSAYLDKDKPLKDDLKTLFSLFSSLTTTAQQAVTIYSTPDSQSISSLASTITQSPEKTLEDIAPQDSVYWMYDNITDDERKDEVSASLVKSYQEDGAQLYQQAESQIEALDKTIGTSQDGLNEDSDNEQSSTLYKTLNMMTTPQKLLEQAEKLNDWYTQASQSIATGSKNWTETTKVDPQSVIDQNNQQPSEEDTTSLEDQTSDLVGTMQQLATTSQQEASSTVSSAAKVQDIEPQVKELVDSTNDIQKKTQNALDGLGTTVSKSQKNTDNNTQYSQRFNKVLANAKNGGADNTSVFNFLASPISAKGQLGTVHQISLVPYYATLIAAILVLVFAITLREFIRRRKVTETDKLVKPNRRWENVPNVILITTTGLVISLIFASAVTYFAASTSAMTLFIYSLLITFSGILVFTGMIRQFRKTSLLLYGAVLGLFFILTPLLGVATKQGSLANILYRISPLQNIQNGYTALLNSSSLGITTSVILCIGIVGGIGLNFVVNPGAVITGEVTAADQEVTKEK